MATSTGELERCPATGRTALRGAAIEIARGVGDQARIGNGSIISILEAVQDGFLPGGSRRQLEDRSVSMRSAHRRRAVEIAGRVHRHGADRRRSVGARAEPVESTFSVHFPFFFLGAMSSNTVPLPAGPPALVVP